MRNRSINIHLKQPSNGLFSYFFYLNKTYVFINEHSIVVVQKYARPNVSKGLIECHTVKYSNKLFMNKTLSSGHH